MFIFFLFILRLLFWPCLMSPAVLWPCVLHQHNWSCQILSTSWNYHCILGQWLRGELALQSWQDMVCWVRPFDRSTHCRDFLCKWSGRELITALSSVASYVSHPMSVSLSVTSSTLVFKCACFILVFWESSC